MWTTCKHVAWHDGAVGVGNHVLALHTYVRTLYIRTCVCLFCFVCRYKLSGELAEVTGERSFKQALSVALEGDRIVLWAYDKEEVGHTHLLVQTYTSTHTHSGLWRHEQCH